MTKHKSMSAVICTCTYKYICMYVTTCVALRFQTNLSEFT